MERAVVEAAIREAFAGVRLGSGVSLREAQAVDTFTAGLSERELAALPHPELTDDWAAVPHEELERDCTAYLDAEGLRYYLPAFMLWLLDRYNDDELRLSPGPDLAVIGTIMSLDQRERHPLGFFELLSPGQRRAIGLYVRALPDLVDLNYEDAAKMARAWRDVWSHEITDDA